MGEIKSALELALERTQDIKSDPDALRRHEARTEGKRLFAKVREDETFDVAAAIKAAPKESRDWIRQGLVEVARSSLTLPQSEADLARTRAVERALAAAVRDRGALSSLMQQVTALFTRYLEDRNQLIEELRRRWEPRLRQREQQLAQQYGRPVQLDPASDPEFAKALQENMAQLESHYRGAVEQADSHIRQLLER